MLILTSSPARRNIEDNSIVSVWSCARHPYLFLFQRQDANVLTVSDVGGFARFTVDLNIYSTLAHDGVRVFYSVYGTAGTVTSATSTPTQVFLQTDIPYAAASGGYLNILMDGYHVESTITIRDPKNPSVRQVIKDRRAADPTGVVRVDVQSYVASFTRKLNLSQYDQLNILDSEPWGTFQITFQEIWYLGSGAVINTPETEYFFLDATKKLGDLYGQNLADYVPNVANLDYKAKFLSDFKIPTYFPGYPFDLGFIWPAELRAYVLQYNAEFFDTAGTPSGTDNSVLDGSQRVGVNRLHVLDTAPGSFDVWLTSEGIGESNYVETGYVEPGYYETTPGSGPSVIITEKKRIKVGEVCDDPIYLSWRNTLGVFNYWLFSGRKQYSTAAKQEGAYAVEPQDIQTGFAREMITQARQSKRIVMGALVTPEDFIGISGIEGSPHVQMLFPDPEAEDHIRWLTVRMVLRGFRHESVQNMVEVEVEIELPELYTVSN